MVENQVANLNGVDGIDEFYRRFDMGDVIRQGTLGTISFIVDKTPERQNIGMVKFHDLNKWNFRYGFGDSKKWLLQEAQLLKTLNYKHIVKAFSSFVTDDETIFIVMELCDSWTVRHVIEKHRQDNKVNLIEPHIVLNWVGQLISGLLFLFEENIIHRNIKPDTLYLKNNQMTLKIGNFDMAIVVQG